MQERETPKLRPAVVVAGLVFLLLAGVAIFRPATTGPFVFDDFSNLANLEQLDGKVDRAHLGQYLAAFTGSPGRPLAALSFVIEDSAWPTDSQPYKRDNVLWHLLCGVLVFAFSRRIARAAPQTTPWADAVGLATMAAWLLHPMQLSATMLVVQRMNILSGIAALGGLLGYAGIVGSAREAHFGRVVAAGGTLAFAAVVAFLCKENGVLVFAYAAVLNATLLRTSVQRFPTFPRRVLVAGCLAPLAALAVAALLAHGSIAHGYANRPFTLGERLLTESRILVDYLQGIVMPRIGGQGIFHDDYPVSHGLLSPPTTALAILFIAAALAAAWRWRAKHPLFAFAVGWFFAGHLIESTVWPLELYFEHRNYLPMVGPLYALAVLATRTPAAYRRGAWALVLVWLLMASGLTLVNARVWGDRGALATVWLQENPRSVRAVQMMSSYQYDRGDKAGARRTMMAGLARMPEAGELAIQVTLIDCYTRGLTPRQYEGMVALARHVRFSHALTGMAGLFGTESRANRCKGTLPDRGFERLVQALLANPAVRRNRGATGNLYVELSKQAVYEGDLDATMSYLDAAYDADRNPFVLRNAAIYLLTAGLPAPAMEYLRRSEEAPQPLFKRWALDIPRMNARLWAVARRMQESQQARAAAPPVR